ncbi:MAG TPA: 4-hydroxy-3-methylbut-2-enyl diphosphate reductase, partial [Candidatus Limnocylindria bacterium]|nr:4-hydroxy-3-methylbut-2-enyl diphosphate reductase [Candidatus Limnocylindria bacterium]
MKILPAEHRGMCFGVRDAIEIAKTEIAQRPVTLLGDLVHNETVMADLRRRGVLLRTDLDDLPTQRVMITAHGASQARMDMLKERGLDVVDTTCPLVRRAHSALAGLVAQGFHPVVIGQRGHVEVRGLTEDYPECDVILTPEDVAQMTARERFGVVSQTTQPKVRVDALRACLAERFPNAEIRFRDTVCQPTKDRQRAAMELAQRCDVVVVIGGAASNNTRELASSCRRYCPKTYAVQSAQDLNRDWFWAGSVVGVTAGTSTPDIVIEGVESVLHRWADELNRAAREDSEPVHRLDLVPVS